MSELSNLILEIQTIAFDQNTTGDKTILAATAGKRFVCVNFWIHCTAANTLTFKSGSTNISGAIPMAAGQRLQEIGDLSVPVFKGSALNEAFILNMGSAAQVTGWFNVYEIDQ